MSGKTKAQRLEEMKRLYIQRAYTDIALAEKLGVSRETVFRDRKDLMLEYPVEQDDEGRWYIPRAKLISEIKLNLHEALPLYLAGRKTSRQTRFHQPHTVNAVEKLAATLRQPMTERLLRSAERLMGQEKNPDKVKIIETLAQAWVEQRKVRIEYQALGTDSLTRHTISTYLIEPSIWSDSVYVIAQSDFNDQTFAFKIERILSATISGETFDIPESFDDEQLLKHAWGIWYADRDPVTVRLRFSPAVTRRVKESIWHPLERVEETGDGGCIWSVEIAEWREMLPWVRGWGADVEVLEPEGLRKELMNETKRLTRVYNISLAQDGNQDRILRLWGKTRKGSNNPEDFHPAVFHMLDVGNIAHELLVEGASPRWRQTLASAFNCEVDILSDWLPYFVALHDIGKVSSAFQTLNKQQLTRLKQEGFELEAIDIPHSHISQIYMEDTLTKIFAADPVKAQIFSEALGGHHGRFAHPDNDIKSGRRKLTREPEQWKSLRQIADSILKDEFLRLDLNSLPAPINISTAIMAFTGFTILCDWLGSDERYFKISPNTDLSLYLEQSRQSAAQATFDSGMKAIMLSKAGTKTETLFADLIPLRALQLAIDDIPDELLRFPSLTIIEAPTGEGKTEAALALAHRIAQLNGTEEMYYALPSMATSNQMFGRLQTHLEKRLGLKADVKLVHGQAHLIEENSQTETPIGPIEPLVNGETKTESNAKETISWFNSKKRALLAPFGVGTVDQAELAALNVKHATLRMMGLVGKVVIVDEVHAYDTYMTTIIERLLGWLSLMNTSVILLSATLPITRRKQLAKAYGVTLALNEEREGAYPNLMVLAAGGKEPYQASPAVWQPNRTIELQPLHFGDNDTLEKAKWLLNAVANGGCACWITNTVKRTQRIFEALRSIAPSDIDLELLHSQIPLDDRQQREDRLKSKYGREGKRPESGKGIVVGTQVLEQSLDLDFDVMVSDLAPMDFLLQRAGRLHRHDRSRPLQYEKPRLWLNYEIEADSDLKIGTDRSIYDEFIMRQTHRTLSDYPQIQLPRDYRTLIEAVYNNKPPLEDDTLYDAWQELQSKQKIASKEARERLLPEPHPRDSFAKTAAMQIAFVEDENRADWVVAKTRLGERTLSIIPLEREGDFVALGDGNERVSLRAEASRETQRDLLLRQLRISNQLAIDEILNDADKSPTDLFTQSALLKGFYPLWLKGGKKEFKTPKGLLQIVLDPHLGLVIEKEKKANDTDE
ncbi:MAG TPA: CRISPR-associated helicase Cas3' [Anaerolineales bacterium]|mgnify:CR=1 FL=1|nr:CRISPR-associated helicase Cas3' [Anaerolineales bacterium]